MRSLLALLLVLVPLATAQAAGRGELDLGTALGVVLPSSGHELYDPAVAEHSDLSVGPVLALRAGWQPLSILGAEVELDGASTGAFLWGGRAHAVLLSPWRILPERFEPFVVVGGGALGVASKADSLGSDADWAFHWGPGLEASLSDRVQLRIDARHLLSAHHGLVQQPAHHGQILVGLAWVLTAGEERRIDRDRDGLLDRDDPCPEQAEVVNGWLDEDGCPDQLGQLQLLVQVDGKPRAGAEIAITTPDSTERLTSKKNAVELEVLPGTYRVRSTAPGYLVERVVEVAEGDNYTVLDLELVDPALVSLDVRDDAGDPLTGAKVSFSGDDAPLHDYPLGRGSTAELELPPGTYSLFVTVDKYSVYREDLTLAPGQTLELDAVLGGAKVKVTRQELRILDKVFFETDVAVIDTVSYDLLDEVANVLLTNPHIELVEIAGHTDDQGTEAHNQELSEDRAAAVMDYLVGQGVESSRLAARGYGELVPVDSNATQEGRARNRRVEFKIIRQ